jgi:hypothetical protein
MECQRCICQAYQLSLSLRKSCIFSKLFECVGIDVCPDRNPPAMSKHQLLEPWPQPEFIRDVEKLSGLHNSTEKFIPHYEL